MLKDLNRFISSTRLVIRNLPPNLDEPKLKKLIYKFATVKLKMTELKIMKDLKTGKSKGFAFATFAEDEMALSTLRYSCNNITTTLIQISRLFSFGFFSKTNHQMMI